MDLPLFFGQKKQETETAERLSRYPTSSPPVSERRYAVKNSSLGRWSCADWRSFEMNSFSHRSELCSFYACGRKWPYFRSIREKVNLIASCEPQNVTQYIRSKKKTVSCKDVVITGAWVKKMKLFISFLHSFPFFGPQFKFYGQNARRFISAKSARPQVA